MPEVQVRPLRLRDVAQMASWGKHDDLRFQAYNFNCRTSIEYLSWYLVKRQLFRKWVYGAFVGSRLIGYITVKNLNKELKTAEMGISFDPGWISQGYGTAALRQYLELVFERFDIDRVWLKTASFNTRAIRCYEKAGFVAFDQRREPYEDQAMPVTLVNQWPEIFKYRDDLAWMEYIYMEFEKRVRE